MVCIPGTPRYNCTVPVSAPVLYDIIYWLYGPGEQGGAVPACIALRVPVVHASFTLNTTTPKGTVPYRTERTVLAHLRPPLERLCGSTMCLHASSTAPRDRWLCVLPGWQINVNVLCRARSPFNF